MNRCAHLPLAALALCIIFLIVPPRVVRSKAREAQAAEPGTALDYFRRADNLTNIRLPGAAPFHMKVSFSALPVVDLAAHDRLADSQSALAAGHPYVMTGDGTYEETWVSPEKWRREVTFAGYHAVEIRGNGTRKFEASSDYEPIRVLTLLTALLTPVPRYMLEPEIHEHRPHWTIEHLSAGNIPYIRASSKRSLGQEDIESVITDYIFLPNGLLVRADHGKVVTTWQKPFFFGGQAVPQRIVVNAMGREVLTADIHIEPVAQTDTAMFMLPGAPAEPGMTLRPISYSDLTVQPYPEHEQKPSFPKTGFFPPVGSGVALNVVIDRTGVVKEVELIDAVPYSPDDHDPVPPYLVTLMRATIAGLQHDHWHPATVDKSPCEFSLGWYLAMTRSGLETP